MLDSALKLLDAGMSIIPVQGKRPLVAWQEYQTRRATEEEVREWFTVHPDAGVGIVTGAISNLVVLDVDGDVGDPFVWVNQNNVVPTMAVRTPRGGLHLYYTHPGEPVQNAVKVTTIAGLPVDIRGDGGFVVAPPSPGYARQSAWRHMAPWNLHSLSHGRDNSHGQVTSLADLDLSTAEDLFAPAPEGGRNHAAARLAGYLLKTCRDQDAAYVQLRQWNNNNPSPLPEYELRRTFESIARREAGQARVSEPFHIPESGVETTHNKDLLDGAAWAEQVANAPERDGLRLDCLPLADTFSGFCEGDLCLLAARPGTGKSTLAWGMAWELAITQKVPTMIFSGEMDPASVARWMTHIRTHSPIITSEDWQGTLSALREAGGGLSILNRGIMTPQMIGECVASKPGTRFVFIDHIQKCRLAKSESRNQELEQIASELKALAMALKVTVFALCQLNRLADNVEHPTIAHLRDSGGLEQEADTVLGLSHVGDRLRQDPYKATIRIATLKSRHGPENEEQLAWFHKSAKRFEWLRQGIDWRAVQ